MQKKPAKALFEDIEVERDLKGNYHFSVNKKGSWKLYTGKDIFTIDRTNPITTLKKSDQFVYSGNKDLTVRSFFIAATDTETLYLSERRLPLKKQRNFRDMGGIKTKDGYTVKYGKIFRSGHLGKLNAKDLKIMESLNIKRIIDFRNDTELQKPPDRYPNNVKHVQVYIGAKDQKQMDYRSLFQKYRNADSNTLDSSRLMRDQYKRFPAITKECYAHWWEYVLHNKEEAIVFHCSTGKDRTGFAAILFLSALGVDRETIINEYLSTNYYNFENNERDIRKASLIGLKARETRILLTAKREYPESAFKIIDEEYGGMDAFLKSQLGFDKAMEKVLREMYLY